MTQLEDLVDRADRLVLRHHELKRTHLLLQQQLAAVAAERDGLRHRLTAARARIDALLVRLPPEGGHATEPQPARRVNAGADAAIGQTGVSEPSGTAGTPGPGSRHGKSA